MLSSPKKIWNVYNSSSSSTAKVLRKAMVLKHCIAMLKKLTMGTVEAEISMLTNEELAERLRAVGESHGPITPTTRLQYERKLKRRLTLQSAANCTITYSVPQSDSTSDGSTAPKHPEATVDSEKIIENNVNDSQGPFYGVKLLPTVSSDGGCVFSRREDALRLTKENPGARFKVFQTHSEAELFSQTTGDPFFTKLCKNLAKVEPPRPVPNEGSLFKAPKPQDLTILRKALEKGDLNTVRTLVWSNPRYLIGSGDNPTILQEGPRYNAIHVCAFHNQAEAAKLILDTTENPEFMKLMYPDDSEESRWRRINVLSDMYLNTPDKGNNEVPLHFACKFGFPEVVSVLAKHPKTQMKLNRYNETPKDVICSRVKKPSHDLKVKILRALESQYYVPLLRSNDNVCPAKVAQPWCPCEWAAESSELIDSLFPIPSFAKTNLDRSFSSPKDSPMSVRAYAGPMSPSEAKQFHKKWLMSGGGLSPKDLSKYAHIRRSDINKGLERIGRELAKEMQVPWCEYWDFLEASVDLETEEGLQKLEEHLSHKKDALLTEISRKRETEIETQRDLAICDMLEQLHLSGSDNLYDCSLEENSLAVRHKLSTGNHLQICIPKTKDEQDGTRENSSLPKPNCDSRVNSLQLYDVADEAEKTGGEADVNAATVAEDDDWDVASFHTAVDDLDLEYSECSDVLDETWQPYLLQPVKVFMMGDEPCKTDADVLRAIERTAICAEKYPLLCQWKVDALSYPEEVRNRWTEFGTKTQQKLQQHSTPKMCSTPTQHRLFFDEEENLKSSPIDSDSSSSSSPSSSLHQDRSIRMNLFSYGSFAQPH